MELQQAIGQVVSGQSLSEAEMESVMHTIMSGGATDAQIAGLLVALRMKGESIDEVTGAARAMRSLAAAVTLGISPASLVDVVGTGGDDYNTFNISTCSALVASAAGVTIAKHGNRSITSACGAADVLERMGVKLDLSPEQVAKCVETLSIGFMFAQKHHGAMRHAIGPRRELGIRTMMNLLGPMTNPASAERIVMGVYSPDVLHLSAEVLSRLGAQHCWVVHSEEGLDELSVSSATRVVEYKNGATQELVITPESVGLDRHPIESLLVNSVDESEAMLRSVLNNESGAAQDVVALNAGAVIYVAGLASDLQEGVAMAQDAIGSGLAKEKLASLVQLTDALVQV